ncbi:TPA: BrxA/BrxB family bacilliredoxin [Staphylococcus aureus]|nr:BrxA/BrxB family bacilliredoxin [Staphylococcus aureus]
MDMNFDLYMNGVVEQARNEIESAGYEQLTTAEDVDKVLKQDGTTLVMINSVALVKDGKITEMIERHQIEGHDVMNVINQLQTLFNKYCEER